MKRTIKRLLAAVSAVSVLTFSGLSVSAATAEDVIGAARCLLYTSDAADDV